MAVSVRVHAVYLNIVNLLYWVPTKDQDLSFYVFN